MISVTSAQLHAWIAALAWPLARILGLIATAPVLGNQSVPARVKIGLALFLTLVVAPTLPPFPEVSPASGTGLLILAQQTLIGLAMGFAMRIVFAAVEAAGEIAGLQMGLGFATFYDPQSAAQTPVIGSFLGLVMVLLFLALDGHLLMISALVESFTVLPIGAEPLAAASFSMSAQWGGQIFTVGLLLALPLVAALLLTNLALGVLSRTAPQLNIFAVGFPITLAIGFLALALTLPHLAQPLERLIQNGLATMLEVARLARPS